MTLKLTSKSDDAVVYAFSCRAGGVFHQGTARVEVASGAVTIDCEAAPEWLVTLAHSLLRGAWRSRDSAPWPRRVTRWRAAPES